MIVRKWLDWVSMPVDSILLQVPRALMASVICATLDVALLVLFVEHFGLAATLAATVSYLLAGVLQYVLCVVWVFPHAPRSAAVGFLTFTVLSLVGLAITFGVIAVIHDHVGMPYMLAKVAALGLAFVWNFSSRKYIVFKSPLDQQEPAGDPCLLQS